MDETVILTVNGSHCDSTEKSLPLLKLDLGVINHFCHFSNNGIFVQKVTVGCNSNDDTVITLKQPVSTVLIKIVQRLSRLGNFSFTKFGRNVKF